MTFRNYFLIAYAIFTVYGAYGAVVRMRKLRAPRNYKGPVLTWAETPPPLFGFSGLRYEGGTSVAIFIHRLVVIAVGLAEGLLVFIRPMRPALVWGLAGFVVLPVLAMFVAVAGYQLGAALFFPLAERLGGDRHFAVSAEGILYLGQLFPWNAFRGFSLAAEGTAVRLWSGSFPGMVNMVLVPPPEKLPELLALLQRQLPDESASASGGFLTQAAFPALMAGICAPIALAAGLLFRAPAEAALAANGLLLYLLATVGGKGFMRLGFAGKARSAPLDESPVS